MKLRAVCSRALHFFIFFWRFASFGISPHASHEWGFTSVLLQWRCWGAVLSVSPAGELPCSFKLELWLGEIISSLKKRPLWSLDTHGPVPVISYWLELIACYWSSLPVRTAHARARIWAAGLCLLLQNLLFLHLGWLLCVLWRACSKDARHLLLSSSLWSRKKNSSYFHLLMR